MAWKTLLVAAVSVDGFIADADDTVGPLFDWYGNGEVPVTFADADRVFRVSEPSAGYVRALDGVRVAVIGRHLFDLTNGWNGVPVVFGTGKRFFGSAAGGQQLLDDPQVIQGDRVLHQIYDMRRR